ncbi:hypothetical protein FAF44_37615 [Nonomuraea sp. MG754425]|uniref:hypothetical protein n=1 Tax=Nonomuraea sp. MG754425 TaxID=2570319 RepID=UPI001F2E3475|nr:hypothetical protein [Nonomuraea sp. MG754425]MCF6474062.1 hypothetical protein [Nonomuraea sp. MG754425]
MSDQRAEMGRVLGLDEAVSEEVLCAALADATYAANLLTCRRHPDLLRHLLKNPPRRQAEVPVHDLLARAGGALVNWARTGFTHVDEETYQRRVTACERCPELRDAPQSPARRALYTIATLGLDDKSICGKCGCSVVRKARLTSETCPAPDPGEPGMTRWQEPMDRTDDDPPLLDKEE